jgi:cobalt-zinc-cadmium efflux system protein
MLSVATIGLIVNLITFKMLHSGEHDNLNIRAAMLHVLSDLLGSVAAIIAGVVIYFKGWLWVDPALSLVVAALIVRSGIHLIKDSLHILLEGVPRHIDVDEVRNYLEQKFPEVENIHHVHTWSLNNDEVLMTMHVKVDQLDCVDRMLQAIHHELEHKFKITHATVQIEKAFCSSRLEQA